MKKIFELGAEFPGRGIFGSGGWGGSRLRWIIINGEKPGVGIGWFTNTKFYGVDTQPLFDDHFCPLSTIQQGGEYVTTTKIWLQASKNTVKSHIKSWRSIFTEATDNMVVKYTNNRRFFKSK